MQIDAVGRYDIFSNQFSSLNIYDLVICLLQIFVIVELMPYL
jgi:uncharacterized membrane protein (DUF373 family)